VKATAIRDVFRPAMDIVEDLVITEIPEGQRFLAPKLGHLKRQASLHRAKARPRDPTDLAFVVRIKLLFRYVKYCG